MNGAEALPLGTELPAGSRFGSYLIRGTLGSGGMGVVYLAEEIDSARLVALKTLHERDPVALYSLKREFRSLADVSHPNLVSLGELATEGGRPFFTMELVEGIDFQRWIDAGPPQSETHGFARLRHGLRQIACGLRALHVAGKVHCDLKPSNILVTNNNRIVIVDFGLVREQPAIAKETSGQLWGTALYMAPEQALTARIGPPADWYGLGVILYRILTGQFPFVGTNLEILLAKQEREPPPPSAIVSGIPPALDQLCSALLRRAPEDRPGSAGILEYLGGADAGEMPRDTASLTLGSVFVGRRDELTLLSDNLAAAEEQRTAVLLSGASGLGKTSLVHHFLEMVRARHGDAVLLTGRCYQRDYIPYRAVDSVVDSLSDYLRRREQVELATLLPPDASLLGRAFPVLARVPAIAGAAPPEDLVADRQQFRARVFTALRHLLSRLADHAPVIVFIDDLQWADADGLALLGDVLHAPSAPRLLFLATVRTEPNDPLTPRLAELVQRLGQVVELGLAPLPPEDAEELAEIHLERLDPSLIFTASKIASEAAGHPLFIDELVRFRVRSYAQATSLDDTIWQRLRSLNQPGQALMAALAIAAAPLDVAAASLATGTSVELTERLAQQLASEHLARAVPAPDGGFAFEPYHDRVREVLTTRLGDKARTRWHRRLADALFETGAAAQSLVRHLSLAGDPHHAARLAVQAADRAGAALAFETAAELYRLALDKGEHGEAESHSLQRALADALINAGRGREAAAVLEQLAAAVGDQEDRADCMRRAAEQLLLSGHLERGLALLDSVAAEWGVSIPASDRGALASLAWRRLKLRVGGTRWRQRHSSEVPEQALFVQDVHHSVGTIIGLVDPIRGLALLSQAALLAFRLGVRDRVVRALTTEAVGRASAGYSERAAALLERASQLAEEDGDPGAITWVAGASAFVAFTTGRFVEVPQAVDRALALHASLPREERARLTTSGVYEASVLSYCRMLSLAYLGRCRELRRDFHGWLANARQRGDRFSAANAARGLNIVWLLDDDPERARRELCADLWTPPEQSFHIQHWTVLRSTVQTDLYCGVGAETRTKLAAELARSKRALLLRAAPLAAEHHWLLGRLALAEAEAERDSSSVARRHRAARRAARRLDRIHLPHASTASALLRAGIAVQRGDLSGALEQLLHAEVIACRSGLRLMEAAAQRRRGELVGGDSGRELVATVDDWASREGIRCPHKIVRMYAPGFDAAA